MSDIKQELDKIRGRISEPSFLKNEGLSNEVGIHVRDNRFCNNRTGMRGNAVRIHNRRFER